MTPARWDIFCSVVDNYGDIGVAWRLARQLASEYGIAVRLWVDNLQALTRIAPGFDGARDANRFDGVEVRRWTGGRAQVAADAVADAVIEAFGCGIPDAYVLAMSQRRPAPVWVVLEYLSAESWIESRHGLPSPHPLTGLERSFFFPGFASATGGVLRESGLLERRDAFQRDPAARDALWREIGVTPPAGTALTISLFCYPEAPVLPLLDAWAGGDTSIACIVPGGVAAQAIDRWIAGSVLRSGRTMTREKLTLIPVRFLSQEAYDRLLWACDLNFVRGEDSFVRAQWAARPLVWNAYAQPSSAHAPKLDAFLDRYERGLAAHDAAALRSFSMHWNAVASAKGSAATAWPPFVKALPALQGHARDWAMALSAHPDLSAALVKFVSARV